MGRIDKLLTAWRNRIPREVRVDDVRKVLRRYGFVRRDTSGGSHFVFAHDALETRPDLYGSTDPHISVPTTRGGKYVKGFYVKDVLQAIDVVLEWDESKEPEIIEVDPFEMQIPICCREGWPDCPHVVNREPVRTKKNIGL